MRTNDVLVEAEPLLRQHIRDSYDLDTEFEAHTFGTDVLQTSRLLLTDLGFNTYSNLQTFFQSPENRHGFFSLVDAALDEPSVSVDTVSLIDIVDFDNPENSAILATSDLDNSTSLSQSTSHVLTMGITDQLSITDYQIMRALGSIRAFRRCKRPATSASEATTSLMARIRNARSLLERGTGRNYFALRAAYAENVAGFYEQVRCGELTWRDLSRRNIHFFDWSVNLQETVRYSTSEYLLPHYDCSLNNLPIQGALIDTLSTYGLGIRHRIDKVGIRGFFLIGFPEMAKSPHWNEARWPHKKLTEEQSKAYSKFNRHYLFYHRLSCRTKEDVIYVLNKDIERVLDLAQQERISIQNGHRKKSPNSYTVIYDLIADLDDPMYAIKPWELKYRLPNKTFRNKDGTVNEAEVRVYLKWVHDDYGIPDNLTNYADNSHIPHYNALQSLGLSAARIRKLCPNNLVHIVD